MRGGVGVAVLVLVGVVSAVPVFAFESKRVHTVVVPVGLYTFGDKSAVASCPGGEHVQFGGYSTTSVPIRGMRRSADNRWTVDATNLTAQGMFTPQAGKATSIAYCTSGAVPLKVTRSKRVGAVGGVTATCPAGTVVLGGGFATSPHSFVGIQDLERIAADQWRVRIATIVGTPRSILTSIAYCGKGPAPKLVRSRVVLSPHTFERTAVATCAAGNSLMFGGVIEDGGYAVRLNAPTSSSWRATVIAGVSVSGQVHVTALAYCR